MVKIAEAMAMVMVMAVVNLEEISTIHTHLEMLMEMEMRMDVGLVGLADPVPLAHIIITAAHTEDQILTEETDGICVTIAIPEILINPEAVIVADAMVAMVVMLAMGAIPDPDPPVNPAQDIINHRNRWPKKMPISMMRPNRI